jgi:hypothetical protein
VIPALEMFSRSIIHDSKSIIHDSKSIIHDSKSIIHDSRSISDESRVTLQLVASFMIAIFYSTGHCLLCIDCYVKQKPGMLVESACSRNPLVLFPSFSSVPSK